MAAMGAEASSPRSSSRTDTQYSGFEISALPEELFVHVLTFVPATDIVKNCFLVSKHWLQVARDQSLWRRKCEREGRYVEGLMGPPPENFMLFYFKNPYRRNLLKNTHATDKCRHWEMAERWQSVKMETFPAGADPITDYVPLEETGGRPVRNWVTSYQFSSMSQRVRLLEEGCSKAVLDNLRPPIYISAWCAARWDCGSRFQLTVTLLNEGWGVIDKVEKEMDLVNDALRRAWHKVEHTFIDYKPGVRFVEVSMGGVDTQFWAGNYGSKFTLPCVRFLFNK